MVSPNKKRSFLPTVPCAKTGRGRKERMDAPEDDQGGSSSQASSSGRAGFLETFDPRSDVARTPRACEEGDGSPHPPPSLPVRQARSRRSLLGRVEGRPSSSPCAGG